ILTRLYRPQPRILLGEKLRGVAHAAIDISDGLAADLGHILEMSKVGAQIDVDALPLSDTLRAALPLPQALDLALNSGDDYELCFTGPSGHRKMLQNIAQGCGIHLSVIGVITKKKGLSLQFHDGKKYDGKVQGYQHF